MGAGGRRVGASMPLGDPSSVVWAAGRATAWAGAALCAAALFVAYVSFRAVAVRFAVKDYASGLRRLAAGLAIVMMLAGTGAMPAYDRQRSYRPVALLVREEIERGRLLALASRYAQIVGEFVFYTGRPMPLVEPVPGARAFLEAGPEPRGVVVRTDQLATVEDSLQGVGHEVR